LNGEISFLDIPRTIEQVMNAHQTAASLTLESILEADRWARKEAETLINR